MGFLKTPAATKRKFPSLSIYICIYIYIYLSLSPSLSLSVSSCSSSSSSRRTPRNQYIKEKKDRVGLFWGGVGGGKCRFYFYGCGDFSDHGRTPTPRGCISSNQLRPEGRNRRGETRLRGPEVLGPLRGLGIPPLVSVIRGLGNPFRRGPFEPRKGSQGLGGGSSGASERCVRFQRSGERRWAIEPSGSYPQARDNFKKILENPLE